MLFIDYVYLFICDNFMCSFSKGNMLPAKRRLVYTPNPEEDDRYRDIDASGTDSEEYESPKVQRKKKVAYWAA